MKKILLFASLGVLCAAVLVERQPTTHSLDGRTFPSEEACLAAAREGLGSTPRACITTTKTVVVGVCEGQPVLASEARAVQISVEEWRTEVNRYAAAPYPACWAIEWVPLTYSGVADTPEVHEPYPEPEAYR